MSSECSSIPDAKYFNNKYKYPHWFTRKKYIFHNKMLRRLRKLRYLHSRSSQYYEKMNFKLSAPSIVITALSGIASFMSTSQYVDNDSQNAFGISVGVMASLSSIFQALSAACQYSVKKEAHRTVAEQYNALIVKTKFEMEMPNEEDFVDKLEQTILDIQAKCNYFVPQFIIDEWRDTEITNTKNNSSDFKEHTDQNISMFYDDENDNDSNNLFKKETLDVDENTYLLNENNKNNDESKENSNQHINGGEGVEESFIEQSRLESRPHIHININEADLDSLNGSVRSSHTLSPEFITRKNNNVSNLDEYQANNNSDNRSSTI